MKTIHAPWRGRTLVLALLLAGASTAQAANYSANLSVTPTNFSGECPAKITFDGMIKTDKSGRVQYKLIRSDGAFAPVETLEFAAAGSKSVSHTWTLGGASLSSYSGWGAIQIVYPTSLQSNKASFKIECRQPKPTVSAVTAIQATAPLAIVKPVITGYRHPGQCVAKGSRFTILGNHFGRQGDKRVGLGGHRLGVELPVSAWSETEIIVALPSDPRIDAGQWYYTGIKNTEGNWISNINKNITVCASAAGAGADVEKPTLSAVTAVKTTIPVVARKPVITGYRHAGQCVAKGSQFTILGSHFGDRRVKSVALGGHRIHVDLPVSSWSDSQIVVTLPHDPRIEHEQWYYTGIEKDDHTAWLSNIDKNITICKSASAVGNGKPDLVVSSFGLKKWGECKADNRLMTFAVTVANIGTAPSPAATRTALVSVKDQHGVDWGNGTLLGAIAPGAAQTVEVGINYLRSDPGHMTAGAPHPFKAMVDFHRLVDESNEDNNDSRVIMVNPRKVCQGRGKGK